MNCWDSINITKQLGFYRSILASFLFGLISFIILYLFATFFHQDVIVLDPGFLPIAVGLFLLPAVHKFLRILPIFLVNKQFIRKRKRKKVFSFYWFSYGNHFSKSVICGALVTPTLFITIPLIAGSYMFASYYPFFLLGASLNLSLSYIDFLCLKRLWKAPKKSIITKEKESYDILIPR